MSTQQAPFALIHQPGPTGVPLHAHSLDELETQARAEGNALALAVLAAADELREYEPFIRTVETYGDPADLATAYEDAIGKAERLTETKDTAVQALQHARDRIQDLIDGEAGDMPTALRTELTAVMAVLAEDTRDVENAAGGA